jgi:hypothetical protein
MACARNASEKRGDECGDESLTAPPAARLVGLGAGRGQIKNVRSSFLRRKAARGSEGASYRREPGPTRGCASSGANIGLEHSGGQSPLANSQMRFTIRCEVCTST